ncbi:MAG: hypothetical protein GXP23_02395 [Gammaproteobacteria bacterium]|nr:hypothetical protein [Gammaproteobacteria bacterium]
MLKTAVLAITQAIKNHPLISVSAAFIIGILFIPVADSVNTRFSSNEFCAGSCHEMESTVSKEFEESAHGMTASGVRPGCADCHLSERLVPALWEHAIDGTKELFIHLTTDVSEPGAYERFRTAGANRVRLKMLSDDSRNCRSCHDMEAIKPERKRGQRQHANAIEDGTTCIACHYNLVHKEVEPSEEFLQKAN